MSKENLTRWDLAQISAKIHASDVMTPELYKRLEREIKKEEEKDHGEKRI